jgi:hypothetical protein
MRANDGRKLDHQTLEAIRLRAVEQVEAGVPAAEVGRGLAALGLHPRTIYTWLATARAEAGRRCAPGRCPAGGASSPTPSWASWPT